MSEEKGGEGSNSVKGAIEAATGLVKAIPIYDDMLQPAAKQIGKTLETVCKAVNLALAPVSGLVWGYEQFQTFIDTKVADRLKDIPAEEIITPKPNVAGPAIEALRYTGHETSLADMYANLLATAMNQKVASGAHPAFVEFIKQLTSDEAKLIRSFLDPDEAFPIVTVKAADAEKSDGSWDIAVNVSLLGENACIDLPDFTPSYIDNLCRLGLIEIREDWAYTDATIYSELESSSKIAAYKTLIEKEWGKFFSLERRAVHLTNLGRQFGDVCVLGASTDGN
ncbi:DUF4393 domain-containing protein [Pseudomonas fitomaticsae]